MGGMAWELCGLVLCDLGLAWVNACLWKDCLGMRWIDESYT